MDHNKIREALTSLIQEVAEQARADAMTGQSNIGGIYDRKIPDIKLMDEAKVKEAIDDINKATATKEAASRLVNAILVAAKAVALITLK